VLGIDKGKKASQVSLKSHWKPPTLTPEKPNTTFADRLANVARENKRKSAIEDERDKKKARAFSAVALASALKSRSNNDNTPKPDETNNAVPVTPAEDEIADEWCKYTGFNLRTRVLPHSILKEEFKGKTTYSVSDLYRLVTPPLYEPPEYDTLDFLVTGIVAQKSSVRQTKTQENGSNYIIIKITDLKVFPILLRS
jgi:hypothetical protein